MTEVLERPTEQISSATDPSARRRWPAVVATLRIARRQVLRAWPTSALILLLIALPMAAVSGGAVFVDSRNPTATELRTAALGQTDAWLQIVGGYDPSRWQEPAGDWTEVERGDDGVPVNTEGVRPTSPEAFLPSGVATTRIGETTVIARSAAGETAVRAVIGEAWSDRLVGRYELIDGRVPRSTADEAMLSPAALERLDLAIGDTLTVTDPAAEYTITGTLKGADSTDEAVQLFLPASASLEAASVDGALWFVSDWTPTWAAMQDLNHEGFAVFARIPPTVDGAQPAAVDPTSQWVLVAMVTVVGAFSGYLIILLAGAAFSVGARRQQRSLALAASVGASRGDLFRIVLLQGTVLGLIGGLIGAAGGIGLAALALHALDDGAVRSFWGLHVPWPLLIGIVVFAAAIGTVAAILPARAVTRGDTLSALRGARKPAVVRVSRPLWGSLIMFVGVGMSLASAAGFAALRASEVPFAASPLLTLLLYGLIIGPVLAQVGVIVAGHWLLSLVSRAVRRLGLAPRLASRDATANPGRIVPAFGAIAACTFIATVVISNWGMSVATSERTHQYAGPLESLNVSLWTNGMSEEARSAFIDDARDAFDASSVLRMLTIETEVEPTYDEDGAPVDDGSVMHTVRVQHYTVCTDDPLPDCLPPWVAEVGVPYTLAVVSDDDIAEFLSADVSAAQLDRYRDGGAIVITDRWTSDVDTVTINSFAPGYVELGPQARPIAVDDLPAIAVDARFPMAYEVFIAPETAERLNMRTTVAQFSGIFDEAVPNDVLDRMMAELTAGEFGGVGIQVERGPQDVGSWLWLTLAIAAALTIAASAVALGLARVERRPDDASLTAVGAGTLLRRNIAWWQAIIVTGFGTITGTLAGLLPVWGAVQASSGSWPYAPLFADVPWEMLLVLAIGLPLAIAAVSWLVRPRVADLTRRTAIG